jgi:hypothetical protein
MQADERVEGLEIRQTLEDACHPRLVALLVYDMQVGILRQIEDGGAGDPEGAGGAARGARLGRAHGVRPPRHDAAALDGCRAAPDVEGLAAA